MSAQQPSIQSDSAKANLPHLHLAKDTCPVCDQVIPNDRVDEVNRRIESRERNQADEITARLQSQHLREKTEAVSQAQQEAAATLDREREQLTARVAAAQAEARATAEFNAKEKIDAAERAAKAAEATLQARLGEVEASKNAAEQARARLLTELSQLRLDSAAALDQAKRDAAANETIIRSEARQQADAAAQEQLAAAEEKQQASEAALQARIAQAEATNAQAIADHASLQGQLEQTRRDNADTLEKLKQDAIAREEEIRLEAKSSAEAALQATMAEANDAKASAETKAAAAEAQVLLLQESHQTEMTQRLQEQREGLERAQADAVNAEKSAAYEDKLKWSAKVEELQRSLDKKTADELGEGAELDLFEVLKREFEGDRIERVTKGQKGADIIHAVLYNGNECGKIIYDSKNHAAWRNDFVTQLSANQMAAKAACAILATRVFPAGGRQLLVQDGVILVHPTRVAALIQIIRQHLIQTHTLQLSAEERTQKTAALYAFITSQRCADLLARIDQHAADLLEMQVKEKKAHDLMWKNQGEAIRLVQKVRAEFCHEIESIIGTANTVAGSGLNE